MEDQDEMQVELKLVVKFSICGIRIRSKYTVSGLMIIVCQYKGGGSTREGTENKVKVEENDVTSLDELETVNEGETDEFDDMKEKVKLKDCDDAKESGPIFEDVAALRKMLQMKGTPLERKLIQFVKQFRSSSRISVMTQSLQIRNS